MPRPPLYTVTRDLHLYAGLFLAPFLLVFSVSVFYLTHVWIAGARPPVTEHVAPIALPPGIESLDGRARVDALQAALPSLGLAGEIGFVRHVPKERRLVFAVSVPGRETSVDIDLRASTAKIAAQDTGFGDGLVLLHKSPGQHLVALRGNWWPMRAWTWFADGTVYLVFFLSMSGLYLWAVLRAERRIGLLLLLAGVFSFAGVVYAIVA